MVPEKMGAIEKFKQISEAYHIPSDPNLRKKYNKKGRGLLDNDREGLIPKVEPEVLPLIFC